MTQTKNLIITLKKVNKKDNKIYNTLSFPIYTTYKEKIYGSGKHIIMTEEEQVSKIINSLNKNNIKSAKLRGLTK
tara:strand:+ start:65 stop:289 length:225 start_codon:yes stop_codon:yes gene_type:complete